MPALYLGATLDGALNEVSHGFENRIEPSMVVSHDVDCGDIVDLCDGEERERRGIAEADMACAWGSVMLRGEMPPSWKIAEALVADGAAGILTPSFANGAKPEHVNLVLWDWAEDGPHRVTVYDPNDRLPNNDQSWR
ncbi:RES domain-containing protein [Rhodobium gokarnense]|uniref:RES domain-containing protein n=2 Tax=Rhodobium gokarnense TaxID=364296 RepID=A0ABT3HGJ8_9HYPH|nr:RES domain-containing protein [Rhodobium gokarnense]